MSGVHRLEHIECLTSANFSQDDTVRPHAQRVLHQIPLRDLPLAFDVRRTRLEPHNVMLLELKLGRILDRDDPLMIGNER